MRAELKVFSLVTSQRIRLGSKMAIRLGAANEKIVNAPQLLRSGVIVM